MEMQIQIENLDKYYGKKTRSGPCESYQYLRACSACWAETERGKLL